MSEVAPTREALGGVWPGELVERDALRTGVDQLDPGAVRDLEPRAYLDAALVQFQNGLLEV